MNSHTKSRGDFARHLQDLDVWAVPNKRDTSGKFKAYAVPGSQEAAPSEETVEQWAQHEYGRDDRGISVVAPLSGGFLIVDIDDIEAFKGLFFKGPFDGKPPRAGRLEKSQTPGRFHAFYRAPADFDPALYWDKPVDGLELRSSSHKHVAIAGDPGYAGTPGMTWVYGEFAEVERWPEPPAEVLAHFLRPEEPTAPETAPGGFDYASGGDPGFMFGSQRAGEQAKEDHIAWCRRGYDARLDEVRRASTGERNTVLNTAAYRIGSLVAVGAVSAAHAKEDLIEAARLCGLMRGDESRKTIKTIDSALAAGSSAPQQSDTFAHFVENTWRAREAHDPASNVRDFVDDEKNRYIKAMWKHDQRGVVLDVPYLIKGYLSLGSVASIVGPSNVGKSFLALDMARSISRGEEWMGCRTKQAPVLYFSLEGGVAFQNRVTALDLDEGDPLHVVSDCGMDLMTAADAADVIGAIEHIDQNTGGLVVIDTLARAFGGGDENKASDMATVMNHAELVARETGWCVLIVHHLGKDATRGARGSSAGQAAIDTMIETRPHEDDEEVTAITLTKQRDMAKGAKRHYRLDVVALGVDQDGDPVTTCRIKQTEDPSEIVAVAFPAPSAASGLRGLLATFGMTIEHEDAFAATVAAGLDSARGELVRNGKAHGEIHRRDRRSPCWVGHAVAAHIPEARLGAPGLPLTAMTEEQKAHAEAVSEIIDWLEEQGWLAEDKAQTSDRKWRAIVVNKHGYNNPK